MSRRTEPTMHLHASPLDVTPRDEDRQDLHETDSIWSHISSVSRKGFARIYASLMRSESDQMTGLRRADPIIRSRTDGSTATAPRSSYPQRGGCPQPASRSTWRGQQPPCRLAIGRPWTSCSTFRHADRCRCWPTHRPREGRAPCDGNSGCGGCPLRCRRCGWSAWACCVAARRDAHHHTHATGRESHSSPPASRLDCRPPWAQVSGAPELFHALLSANWLYTISLTTLITHSLTGIEHRGINAEAKLCKLPCRQRNGRARLHPTPPSPRGAPVQ